MKSLIWRSVTWRPGKRAVLSGEMTYSARPAGRDHHPLRALTGPRLSS
jgi:hypothetical protein